MLELPLKAEGRALRAYENDGDDPEMVARAWIEATAEEFQSVVQEAIRQSAPDRMDWYEDVLATHRWLKKNLGHPCDECGGICYIGILDDTPLDPDTDKPHVCEERS